MKKEIFHRVKASFGPSFSVLAFVLINLLVLSASRLLLSFWQGERVFADSQFMRIFIGGLRIDLSTLGYVILPVLLVLIVGMVTRSTHRFRFLIKYYLVLMSCLLIFFELITPTFILEYDLRPNRLFLDYLIYPQEVFSMLIGGYKAEILITLATLVLGAKLYSVLFNLSWVNRSTLAWLPVTAIHLLLIVLAGLCARGTLEHRPINPALVAFSPDHLLNDLSINSAYSVAFAWTQVSKEISSIDAYGKMPEAELVDIIHTTMQDRQASYVDPASPTRTYHQATFPERKKNLVILLQESLGARYVGKLGGLPLTPNLDRIMDEGWNFTNFFATGTRSVRGIEAVVTGFTPTVSRSVVKLTKSQKNFFTLADFLGKQGYHTQFIYGGESHFDNMKSFFLGNGVTDIVEGKDFKKIDFLGSWGASDGDLYDQADVEFAQLHQQGKSFFSLVFTSSNHSPYDYPDGKIEHYEQPIATRNNAAKYSDYALGEFIKKAKKSDYWKDTVFVVVADHDSRVSGSSLVPIEHFRIPAVIFGQDIPHKVEDRLASQIDLAPTLLSLIGASGYTPMIGNDFTKPMTEDQPRALLQYDKHFAYLKQDKAVVFQPQKAPLTYQLVGNQLIPIDDDVSLEKEAHAYANFGSLAYLKGWYTP